MRRATGLRAESGEELDWTRLGRCPACGTGVLLDDQFVRAQGMTVHVECYRYLVASPSTRRSRPDRRDGAARTGPQSSEPKQQ